MSRYLKGELHFHAPSFPGTLLRADLAVWIKEEKPFRVPRERRGKGAKKGGFHEGHLKPRYRGSVWLPFPPCATISGVNVR